ncbi:MAG: chromate transporter [Bacilli bacterium]|nr:chromate transporter [Bacilli bacterium]
MIYLELFYVFFTIGLFTIGGGYAMIPMLQDQIVGRGWLGSEELLNFFAIAESTPGPFAVNTATLVGFYQGGFLGSFIATFAVVLPSFIIILIIARFIMNFLEYKNIRAGFENVKTIVVGLLLAVVFDLFNKNILGGSYNFKNPDLVALGIMAIILGLNLVFKNKLSAIKIILISGVLGIILYRLFPL